MGGVESCGGRDSKDDDPREPKKHFYDVFTRKHETICDADYALEPLSLSSGKADTGYFGAAALTTQVFLTVCFFFTGYDFETLSVFDSSQAYDFYVGAAVMLFVGFGYIMTFLKAYGLGAIGMTLFIGCLGLQWALLLEGWMRGAGMQMSFNVVSFIQANRATAAVLVSFGALLGKTTPLQVLVLTLCELVFVIINKVFILNRLGVWDVGCTMSVHVFGAFFGLSAAAVCIPSKINEEMYVCSYTSDLLSMLGTVFMWLFWPCFVAGDLTMGGAQQKMAVMNTIFALCGSTVTVFGMTTLLGKKRITTLPIQMATLAGGVAIGAVANFAILPGGAALIGVVAGLISCCMFVYGHRGIPDKYDSTGVMSLHGVPGVFGGLCSVLLPVLLKTTPVDSGKQGLGLACTIGLAIGAGSLTGLLLKMCGRPAVAYNDEAYWDTNA